MHRVERSVADMRKRNNIPRKIRTVRRLMRLINIRAEIIFLRHFQKPVGKTVIIDSGGKVVSFTRQRMKHSAEIAARPCKIPVSIPRKISPAEETDGDSIVVKPVIPAGIAVRFRYTLPLFQHRKILQRRSKPDDDPVSGNRNPAICIILQPDNITLLNSCSEKQNIRHIFTGAFPRFLCRFTLQNNFIPSLHCRNFPEQTRLVNG